MLAKIQPRARTQGRPFIPDDFPFTTPRVLFIDPTDKCNLKCDFCPTGDHELMRNTPGRHHGPMTLDTFKKVIDGCAEFNRPITVFRLYKDGEPLSNPAFPHMVAYAKQSGYGQVVDTTTNAILLTFLKSDALIEAGLDRINISIYGMNTEQYERFCHRSVDIERLIEN